MEEGGILNETLYEIVDYTCRRIPQDHLRMWRPHGWYIQSIFPSGNDEAIGRQFVPDSEVENLNRALENMPRPADEGSPGPSDYEVRPSGPNHLPLHGPFEYDNPIRLDRPNP